MKAMINFSKVYSSRNAAAKAHSFKIHSFRQSCLAEKLILGAAAVVIGLIISLSLHAVRSHAAESEPHVKVYTSVRIERGDTLTDIARTFYSTSDYDTLQDAVLELKELNGIYGDTIIEGCYLVVPEFVDPAFAD